jgi:hypothetical protein
MAQMSICRGCDRVVYTDGSLDRDYVVAQRDFNGNETFMHADCYEAEVDEREAKAAPGEKVG